MRKNTALSIVFCLFYITSSAQLVVQNLLTENKPNPIGIEEKQPRFTWALKSEKRNVKQTAYEIRLGQNMADLAKGKNIIWASNKVSTEGSVHIPYSGAALASGKRYYWQVRVWDNQGGQSDWSEAAYFQMGFLNTSDWKAEWINSGLKSDTANGPVSILRKTFLSNKKIQSATAYITSRGMYEAFINGKRVGDAYLTPGWTSYNKRLQYQTYDVTNLLTQGKNAIGVQLGSGWYRTTLGWVDAKNHYGKETALLMQVEITYSDGKTETIISDASWKANTGAIRFSEIYDGEIYDARAEKTGWLTTSYDDANWTNVVVKTFDKNNLVATYNELVRKHEIIKPVKVITTPKGEQVLDFGQNLVGWVQIKTRGNAGDTLQWKHFEVLDKNGNVYLTNMRHAKAQTTYILRGGGEETFEPHFTFYGFRYIWVNSAKGKLNLDDFTAVVLYSDMKPTGSFECSNPLINQLQQNIQWGQRGNFLDVPTDCPQRDERLGWTGDAQAFSRTASFNYNVNNFFAKWLKDVTADQLENGAIPHVIPNVLGKSASASTGWADVANIIPWNMYLAYGDKKILENQYESMKKWVNYMRDKSKNDLWNTGFHFGDWLFYDVDDDRDGRSAITDKYMIAQCFWAHSTQLLINTAKILGKNDDVQTYSELLNKIKIAFQREYMTPNGRLISSTQTAYTLALNFDMLPENLRAQAAQRLAENIKAYNNHITTGFLGTPYITHVLTRFGHDSTAFKLLLQESYPSWLYPVKMGATTIWERWDGIKPDSTFQTPSMNSFNHYAYGAIGDWLYRSVVGIDTREDGVGYKSISIKPHIGGKLSYAKAALQTYYGAVSSGWKLVNNKLILDVEIPANTTATVYIPYTTEGGITEGGQPITSVSDIQVVNSDAPGYIAVKVGSGKYQFSVLYE